MWLHYCNCVSKHTAMSNPIFWWHVLNINMTKADRSRTTWTPGFRRLMSGIKALEQIMFFAAHAALWQYNRGAHCRRRGGGQFHTGSREREGEEWVCVYLRCVWPQSCESAHTQTVRLCQRWLYWLWPQSWGILLYYIYIILYYNVPNNM